MTSSDERSRLAREKLLSLRQEALKRQKMPYRDQLKQRAESSLSEFIKQAWPIVEPGATLVWGNHLDAICLHLEAVTAGKIANLLITVPPGTTKSLTTCVFWPAWCWTTNPMLRWLFASNEEQIAIRDAVSMRMLIESEWYQENWGTVVILDDVQNAKSWYSNTARGCRICTTVGSNVTGKKGDILVWDDANDARKVESANERVRVCSWHDTAFYNRVNDHTKARRVGICQRTHVDDLAGHCKRTGSWEELCLPEEFVAERKCKTSIGWEDWRTEPGELLRPQRFGPKQVREERSRPGFDYGAQHQQDPKPKGGAVFKEEWFRHHYEIINEWDGGEFKLGDKVFPKHTCWVFMTVDPAASAKDTSKKHEPDFTVCCAWAVTPINQLILLDCWRFRMDIPDIVPQIQQMYELHQPMYVGIEAVASNRAVYQEACRTNMVVQELSPQGLDKLVRAHQAVVLAQSGRVWLPQKAHWLEDWKDEVLNFTGDDRKDKHDDAVDALSYAAFCLTETGNSDAKPMVLVGRRWQ